MHILCSPNSPFIPRIDTFFISFIVGITYKCDINIMFLSHETRRVNAGVILRSHIYGCGMRHADTATICGCVKRHAS